MRWYILSALLGGSTGKRKENMKKLEIITLTALLLGAAITLNAQTPIETNTQTFKVSVGAAQNPTSCPGAFAGMGKMTNSAGGYLFIPPTGATTAVLTDISGYPPPYLAHPYIVNNAFQAWCGTNTVTATIATNRTYQFDDYINKPYPVGATNETVTLQLVWYN